MDRAVLAPLVPYTVCLLSVKEKLAWEVEELTGRQT